MIPEPPAVLLLGHGTRIAAGVSEFQHLAQKVSKALPNRQCIASFLELAPPSLELGMEELIHKGVRTITVMPVMLMAAGHVKNDIPAILKTVQAEHSEANITFGRDLGVHPNMLQIIKTHIEETESAFDLNYDRKATLLLMVGRGTSDSDVNSNISKMTRLIWETMGFGWAETCYCAVTKPLLPEALETTHQLGYRRVIVFPYMLFMGRLIQYIHRAVDTYRAQHPHSKALVAPYLNAHPLIVETLLERLYQTEAGNNQMNCHLCQYKELIVGYEHRHGQPQTSHHHHHHHHPSHSHS